MPNNSTILSMAVSQDKSKLFTGDEQGQLAEWSIKDQKLLQSHELSKSECVRVACELHLVDPSRAEFSSTIHLHLR